MRSLIAFCQTFLHSHFIMKANFLWMLLCLSATHAFTQIKQHAPLVIPSNNVGFIKLERKAVGQPEQVKNMNAAQYQKRFDQLTASGLRPIWIDEVKRQQVIDYQEGETPQIAYWVTFQKFENDYPWVARHNLSAADYQQEFNTWPAKGYMPISLGVGAVGGAEVYAIIFEKRPNPPAWVARHGLTMSDFSQQHQQFLKEGYKLKQRASCVRSGTTIYAALWIKE